MRESCASTICSLVQPCVNNHSRTAYEYDTLCYRRLWLMSSSVSTWQCNTRALLAPTTKACASPACLASAPARDGANALLPVIMRNEKGGRTPSARRLRHHRQVTRGCLPDDRVLASFSQALEAVPVGSSVNAYFVRQGVADAGTNLLDAPQRTFIPVPFSNITRVLL